MISAFRVPHTKEEEAKVLEWETERLVAYIWWCGDDHCDCTQPRIDHISPNRKASYPWIHSKNVWSGTFQSDGEGRPEQRIELEEAAKRCGITLMGTDDDAHYGQCPFTEQAVQNLLEE